MRSIAYIIASEPDQSCVNDDLGGLLPMVVRGLDFIEETSDIAEEELTLSIITRIVALDYHFTTSVLSSDASRRCHELLVGKSANIVREVESKRKRESSSR